MISRAFLQLFVVSLLFEEKLALYVSSKGVNPWNYRAFALSGSPNENDPDALPDQRIPATGWNHNPPKEDSSFWLSPNGGGAQEPPSEVPKKKLRTGWLHNTSPKKAEKKEKKSEGNKAQQRLQQAMKMQETNHRIVDLPVFHACGKDRQIVVTEHRISVPLYRPEKQPRIDLAFTVVEEIQNFDVEQWFRSMGDMSPQQRAMEYVNWASMKNGDDLCLYLQGGPGFGSPTPVAGLAFSEGSSWGAKALSKYKRVVLMDQRGTGKSTPITKQTLEKRFPELFRLDDAEDETDLASTRPDEYQKFQRAIVEATEYMAQFRADNIVKDAEAIKAALMLPLEPGAPDPGPKPWGCALGQSFGGFCMMSYLSLIEHPPRICLLTGGVAPMLTPAFDAYSSLLERVKDRSLRYYDMYPGDIPVVKTIVKKLLEQPQTLPSGGTLTARRFLQLGMALGGSPSSFASFHSKLSSAFLQTDESEFSRAFLKSFDSDQPFDDHPIYYFLHESIYADGPANSPTDWAAHRAYENKIKTPSEFDYRLTSSMNSDDRPTLFFGEMVFPWMSQDYLECGGRGCTALANALASKQDWCPLYDADHMRKVLGDGRSRAAAACYFDDMYVDFNSAMKVLQRGGPLEKCKPYVTNDFQHSGLRDSGDSLFTKLHGMATGSIRTPS
eukprot:scaffold42_cov133-Cylindrotheca_fusiformis.AAC.11